MNIHSDTTAAARSGYYSRDHRNPHLWSSPMWFAFEAGAHMRAAGLIEPIKARMSRGYSVRADTAASAYVIRFSGTDFDVRTHQRAS